VSNYQKTHNKYSSELKREIMDKYKSGNGTINSLSKEYNIPLNTMRNWQRKIVKNINICIDTRNKNSGRRKEENIDYKERYEILKKYQAFLKAQREKK
jgi:transposase-like protein